MSNTMTRQQWLTQFLQTVRPIFRAAGYPLPKIRVGTKRLSGTSAEVVYTWEITINDDTHNGIRAAERLISSLIWRCSPVSGDGFNRIAKLVGYDTDMLQGKRLNPLLQAMVAELPPYPQVLSRAKWLKLFIHKMHPWFEEAGVTLPSIKVIPGRIIPDLLNQVTVITEDGCYIFISPKINFDGTLSLAKTLTRAFVGCVEAPCVKSIGIVENCFTEGLTTHLENIICQIGPYPEK